MRTTLPIVYESDATARLLEGYIPSRWRLLGVSIRDSERLERRAIERADRLVYLTKWVADSAVRDYGADPSKIWLFQPGPNVWPVPERDSLPVRTPDRQDCRLLFLAVGWQRKGGPIALEALRALRRRGVLATLTICGVEPAEARGEPGVEIVPRLDNSRPEDRAKMDELLRRSHFLLLPTRADCFGIVFCDAAAYGLPAITTATGGVTTAIEEGVTGYALPFAARGDVYADVIEGILDAPARYRKLAAGSRRAHEERLNWQVWGRGMSAMIAELLAQRT